jgi:hypothetical protein
VARKSVLNLAVTWKKDIPAIKSALFMAITGTKQVYGAESLLSKRQK